MGTLPHEAPRGLRYTDDLDLGEEQVQGMGCHVSLQDNLLTFTNRLHPLLIQLILEASEHLEKLTFSGEPCLGLVAPHFRRVRSRRALFVDVFDVNIGHDEGGRPLSPNGH